MAHRYRDDILQLHMIMLLIDIERCFSRTIPTRYIKGKRGFPNSEQHSCIAMVLKVARFETHWTSLGIIC
jgi:hypothetical protein